MNTLFAQLMKELKRSPVKAAVLGGGMLLAIWFWLPLVSGWFQSDDAGGQAVTSAPAPTVEAPSQNPVPVAESAVVEPETPIDWRAIANWRQSHAGAGTFAWNANITNLFAPDTALIESIAAEVESIEPVEVKINRELAASQRASAMAALKLTSTLITPSRRSATINGKVYSEGEPIKLTDSAEESEESAGNVPAPTEMEVMLRHVAARSVTLQHGSELIKLQLERKQSHSIQFEYR